MAPFATAARPLGSGWALGLLGVGELLPIPWEATDRFPRPVGRAEAPLQRPGQRITLSSGRLSPVS